MAERRYDMFDCREFEGKEEAILYWKELHLAGIPIEKLNIGSYQTRHGNFVYLVFVSE